MMRPFSILQHHNQQVELSLSTPRVVSQDGYAWLCAIARPATRRLSATCSVHNGAIQPGRPGGSIRPPPHDRGDRERDVRHDLHGGRTRPANLAATLSISSADSVAYVRLGDH